ncbi:restriction endonuclease subunit S [Apilactobacillus xinyiensis]|uniref:restriction endonuclease subunit S n=1 Tax=Apilactobacillus xinyiensis TaxID=2841032 RepID=UPI00200E63C1|nr:restriction endonuclease subunit S [Apilactobacillus xinyiensis]MCL0318312.1 restriction endonuclease subunit S [Apilactobacillus xinyiensis]
MTTSKDVKVPRLRFKEFSGEWEEKKLGNLCETITKGTTPHKNNYPKEVHFIQVNDINKYNGNIKHQHYISLSEHLNYLKRSILKKGDILFSIAGSLGVVSVVKNKDLPANTNQALAILRLKKFHSVFFIDNLLKSEIVNKYIYDNPTVGAQPNLSLSQLYNFKLKLCCNSEQEKIGNFFTKLDRLIELQTKKVEQLKQLKRGYLQKMFPQKGETVPRLRFAGFIGEWEEKQMSSIFNSFSGLSGKTKSDFGHGLAQYVTYVNVHDNEVVDINNLGRIEVDNNQSSLKFGDVLFTLSSETSNEIGLSSVWNYNIKNVYLNSFTFGIRPIVKMNNYFNTYSFRNPSFRKMIYPLAQGISRYNLSRSNFMKLYISFPSLNEQKKIGNFFAYLDKKIELQETKLSQLKDMKKGYLQKMFC